MTKKTRVVVLVLSLFAVMAPAAEAVTWHNSGDTSFTATALIGSLSSTGVQLSCSAYELGGTTGATPFVGAIWTAAQWTATYTGCSLSGQNVSIDCRQAFTASSQSGGVTSGSLDTTCGIYLVNILICQLEGSETATYINPSGTTGSFTLPRSTGLRTTGGTTGSTPILCPMGTGDTVEATPFTFKISTATGGPTPHTGPVITRTP